MKYSGKVKIEKVTDAEGIKSVKNPHSRSNVNVAQGPRTGNESAHAGKRSAFKAEKEERAPLADMIERAFGRRAQDDKVNSKLEPVASDSKRKFKK